MDAAILEVERSHTPPDLQEAVAKARKTRAEKGHTTGSQGTTPIYHSANNSGTATPIPLTRQDGGVEDATETDQPSQPEDSGRQASSQGRDQGKDKGQHPNEDRKGEPTQQGKSAAEINQGDRAEPGAEITIEVDGKKVTVKEQIQVFSIFRACCASS